MTFDSELTLSDGSVYEINSQHKQGCYVEILEKTHEQLQAMLSHHGKVLVMLSIFHVHHFTETNELFSRFMRKLVKHLKKRYGFKRVGYLWVREHGLSDCQHYHLALFLDGNKVRRSNEVFDMCVNIWEGWNQPRPAFPPKRCYYLLNRHDVNTYQKAFYHLSYLSKTRTKEHKPKATNDYSTSRIQPKPARGRDDAATNR